MQGVNFNPDVSSLVKFCGVQQCQVDRRVSFDLIDFYHKLARAEAKGRLVPTP